MSASNAPVSPPASDVDARGAAEIDDLETLIADIGAQITKQRLHLSDAVRRDEAELRLFQYRVWLAELTALKLQHTTSATITLNGNGKGKGRKHR